MIDCLQSIASDEIKRVLWLVSLGILAGTRFHCVRREEAVRINHSVRSWRTTVMTRFGPRMLMMVCE